MFRDILCTTSCATEYFSVLKHGAPNVAALPALPLQCGCVDRPLLFVLLSLAVPGNTVFLLSQPPTEGVMCQSASHDVLSL